MQPVLDLRYIQLPSPEAARSVRDLTPYEVAELENVSDRRRHTGWVAARWLIKCLLRERLSAAEARRFDPTAVSILTRKRDGQRGRPSILCQDRVLGLGVSIAHTSRGVLVGLSRREGMLMGVDLVQPNRVGVGPLDPWYTQTERQWIAENDDTTAAAQVWAVKQAYYKAANRGESFSPRRIEVTIVDERFQCNYAGRSHDLPAYIAVTTCDDHVASLVVILPERTVSEVPETYDSVIPQSELIRIGRRKE